MYYDLLVHVDLPDEQRFTVALNNIANYIAALKAEEYRIVLLANAGAAKFLANKSAFAARVAEIQNHGVLFMVCANALKAASIAMEDVLVGVQIVPAGVVEIVRLQREGYCYLKP